MRLSRGALETLAPDTMRAHYIREWVAYRHQFPIYRKWHFFAVLLPTLAAMQALCNALESRFGPDLTFLVPFLTIPSMAFHQEKHRIYASLAGDRAALRMTGSVEAVLRSWKANPITRAEANAKWLLFPKAKEAPNPTALATRLSLLLREAKSTGLSESFDGDTSWKELVI